MSSAEVWWATPPIRSATAAALSGLTSLTATTRPPAITVWMRSMCAWPMPPGPIIPMRTVTVCPSEEAEAEGGEVLAGLDGVGEREGLVAPVHVLLADDVELLVEVGERLDEVVHVGQTGGRGDRAPGVHRLDERPVLVVGLLDEHRVHRL